jgi:SAM-dependent methyltransferase
MVIRTDADSVKSVRLVTSIEEKPDKLYVLDHGIKRWVSSMAALESIELSLSDLEYISMEELSAYRIGSAIVRAVGCIEDCKNFMEARQFLTKNFTGYGIEFGAALNPTPVPISCRTDYADYYSADEGCYADYSGNKGDFVPVKFATGLQEMAGIPQDHLDYIIACHVIEHVSQTVQALKHSWEKLSEGGTLLMAIPHKEYCFDLKRELTPLEHFIDDYENYCISKDVIHIIDFMVHTKEDDKPVNAMDIYTSCLRLLNGGKVDIHYHTFTEDSFSRLINWFASNVYKWRKIEIINRIPYPGSNEFLVLLTK